MMVRMLAVVLAGSVPLAAMAGPSPLSAPERFDRPYDGAVIVMTVDRSNVWAECSDDGRHKVRKDAAGCAWVEDETCFVYLAGKTRRAPLDDILRHEIAHCNGWPADHPE